MHTRRHVVAWLCAVFAACSAVPGGSPSVKWFQNQSNIPPQLLWPPPPNYNHTVKDLGSASSPAACRRACAAYQNTAVSSVSGWERCQSFTFLPNGQCVAIVDPDEWKPTEEANAVTGRLRWPPASCHGDADCSYNGVCSSDGSCECGAAWRGDRCQTLALQPTGRQSGLRAHDNGANTSTWGGAVLVDHDTGLYHMWASELLGHCGIETWTTNSHVVHAVSSDGITFARIEETLPAFSHEPNVVRAPGGEWVMYWTAAPAGSPKRPLCRQCSAGNTAASSNCTLGAGGADPTYMAWATSPNGPWSTPQRLFEDQAQWLNADTNLAVVILPNASVVGIARTAGAPLGILTHSVTATHWRDAASYKGAWQTHIFAHDKGVNYAGLEDPFLYRDERGIFHAVFHNQIENDDERLCGGHAFSEGGVRWTFTGTAWGNTVDFADGSQYAFSRRERPHLVFGDATAPHKITALTTGVQYGSASPISVSGQDACYTLHQPVRT